MMSACGFILSRFQRKRKTIFNLRILSPVTFLFLYSSIHVSSTSFRPSSSFISFMNKISHQLARHWVQGNGRFGLVRCQSQGQCLVLRRSLFTNTDLMKRDDPYAALGVYYIVHTVRHPFYSFTFSENFTAQLFSMRLFLLSFTHRNSCRNPMGCNHDGDQRSIQEKGQGAASRR